MSQLCIFSVNDYFIRTTSYQGGNLSEETLRNTLDSCNTTLIIKDYAIPDRIVEIMTQGMREHSIITHL